MGALTKEQYEYRRESATQRCIDNKENCNSLSDEQHDLMSEICSMRHEIHSNQDSLYNTESGSFKKYFDWLNDESDECINGKLKNSGLPIMEWSIDIICMPCDNDRYEGVIDNTDEAEEENRDEFYEQCNVINNDIENYLRNIDDKHGTNYCPSGFLRIQ